MQGWLRGAVLSGMLLPVLSLAAQRPLSLGLGGGASLPAGNFGDVTNTGWHALGTIALSTLMQPIGFRFDIAYNQFSLSEDVGRGGGDGSQSVGSATLNITYRLPMTNSPVSPYVISGLGAYQTRCSDGLSCSTTTRYGWNAGLGARLAVLRVKWFVEARYHRTQRGGRSVHYFPLSVGFMF